MQQNQPPFAPVRARRRLAASAVAATCLLLSACGNSAKHLGTSGDSARPTPSTSPSPNPTDTAKAALLVAYQGFWNLQVQAYSKGSLDGLPINTYAIGQADGNIRQALQYYTWQNLVTRGRPVLSPQVASIDLAKNTATIKDCIDTSNFVPVNRDTGMPAQLQNTGNRHPWTFTAVWDNVQWRISGGGVDRGHTC